MLECPAEALTSGCARQPGGYEPSNANRIGWTGSPNPGRGLYKDDRNNFGSGRGLFLQLPGWERKDQHTRRYKSVMPNPAISPISSMEYFESGLSKPRSDHGLWMAVTSICEIWPPRSR